MGILKNADDSPTFTDGDPLGATPLNVLRDTLVAVDEATRLGGYAFTSLYGQHPEENMEPAWVVWRGGFVFLAGMTTLRIVTLSSGTVTGATLRVYLGDTGANDALPATYTDLILSAGQQTHPIPISGAGYTAGQVVRVHLELRRTEPVAPMNVDILAVEALPVSLAGWPGVPTFGSAAAITAANLNHLAAASDWLVARCALRYDPLFILHLRRIGPFRNAAGESDQNVRWYGSVRRTTLHPSVTARGRVMVVWGGATEEIQLVVQGSVVSTFNVPTSLGEHPWELTASLAGYSAGTLVGLQLRYVRNGPNVDNAPVNRWTISEVFTPTPTGGGATLAPWAVRQGGVSAAALVSWLASLAALASAAYGRITSGNDGLWGVQRAFTARPASGMDQFRWFEPWGVAGTWRRAGEALVGRGRGLSLGYGPGYFDEAALKAQGSGGIGAYPLVNNRTHPFIDGDNVETGRLFLDSVPGLYAGAPYNVRGEELYYAAEQLKVVD